MVEKKQQIIDEVVSNADYMTFDIMDVLTQEIPYNKEYIKKSETTTGFEGICDFSDEYIQNEYLINLYYSYKTDGKPSQNYKKWIGEYSTTINNLNIIKGNNDLKEYFFNIYNLYKEKEFLIIKRANTIKNIRSSLKKLQVK